MIRNIVIAAVIFVGACGGRMETGPARAHEQAMADFSELRGQVAIVGSAPLLQTVIRSEGGEADVVVEGPVADSLRSVNGLVVSVRGRRQGPVFIVDSFMIVSIDQLPVHDGILAKTRSGYALKSLHGGLIDLPVVIAGLEPLIGKRIWIVSDVNAGGGRFGHIH